jgi:predicted nucleotide-binding protein (sugar kinase/HSP70/actin superfamily)
MGKSKDFVLKGASGIINIIPFTCMPGNVVTALLKSFREDHNNIPVLNIACDGQEQTNSLARLEAFMYQVLQFRDEHQPKEEVLAL